MSGYQSANAYRLKTIDALKQGIDYLQDRNDGSTLQEKREKLVAREFRKKLDSFSSPTLRAEVANYLDDLEQYYHRRNPRLLIASAFSSTARRCVEFHHLERREIHQSYLENWLSYSLAIPHTTQDARLLTELYCAANMRKVKLLSEEARINHELDWIGDEVKRVTAEIKKIAAPASIQEKAYSQAKIEAYLEKNVNRFDYFTRIDTSLKYKRLNVLRDQWAKTTDSSIRRDIEQQYRIVSGQLTELYREQLAETRVRIFDRKEQLAEMLNDPVKQSFEYKAGEALYG